MRDLLSKLDSILSETELRDKEDLQAKRKALQDIQLDPNTSKDPDLASELARRKSSLEKEAKDKGFSESIELGDEFGISFSEDFEIAAEVIGFVEDGIVIELDDTAINHLAENGVNFLEGELQEGLKDPKDNPCWKGYHPVGTKKKGGKTVPNCVPNESIEEESDPESKAAHDAGYRDASQGRKKNPYNPGSPSAKEYDNGQDSYRRHFGEDHGPEDPEADYNVGEYDREGDMAKDQLRTVNDAAKELYSIIQADENLPEWVQAKITKAMDYLDTARDYLKANKYAEDTEVDEAEYGGRKVQLGKKMAGDVKKYKVYVRNPKGNVVKVNFGDKKMRIKKSNPARRKSFRARHNCSNPGPRHKARYWSCRNW